MHKTLTKFRPHALKIKEAGGNLYIVGGAVRDFLMCKVPHDVDFCVTGLVADRFLELFPNARQQGKAFPVFVVDDCEFAFARTEKKVGPGYNGFAINSDPTITIEEDLYRRDLTINSMAIEVLTGNIIDPYGGMNDITYPILKPTSKHFMEDPVRALRSARFHAHNPGFIVSGELLDIMKELKAEMKYITKDQKFSEMNKALCGTHPHYYFELLWLAELTDIFPELYQLDGIEQAHHTDGDAFSHTIHVLKNCSKLTNDPVILYTALTHDFGKALTPKEILPAHHDHENRSVEIIESIDWVPKEWTKLAAAYAYDHMRGHRYKEMRRGNRVKLLERIRKTSRGLNGFCMLLYADKPIPETMINIAAMQSDYAKIFGITGDDMPTTVPSGETFGQVLHQYRTEVLD